MNKELESAILTAGLALSYIYKEAETDLNAHEILIEQATVLNNQLAEQITRWNKKQSLPSNVVQFPRSERGN